jgi:hypothetical protein
MTAKASIFTTTGKKAFDIGLIWLHQFKASQWLQSREVFTFT